MERVTLVAIAWGEVGCGVLLMAWGLGFALLARWMTRNDEAVRQLAEKRWGFGRLVDWRVRTGRIDRAEWVDRDLRSQRFLGRWILPAGGVIFALLAFSFVLDGLRS